MSTNGASAGASSPVATSESDIDIDMDSDMTTNGDRSDHEATPRPEPVNENEPVRIMPFLGPAEQPPDRYDVGIVGAGPAGLMLGLTLARLGITPLVLDERAEQTPAGRADGMQPKTIETLRMLGLADELLQRGVKVYDICLWHAASTTTLQRVARETHYPAFIVDLVDPFVLIGHQGMVERVFVDDLAKRGISVRRCHKLDGVSIRGDVLELHTRFNVTRDTRTFETAFLVGCDGAHSRVRKLLSPSSTTASSHRDDTSDMSVWGVLDGEVDTDFPDIWTKTVVFSEQHGSLLIMPRERDMTRLYIEMRPDADNPPVAGVPGGAGGPRSPATLVLQAAIMQRAAQILRPYRIRWRSIEWFGQYRVSQRVAPRFAAPLPGGSGGPSEPRVFLAGDAAHTHSPKASQGMNTALHDSWNLAWKLNLAIRGLCDRAVLLGSYEAERQKIARDLVAFDYEHANEMSRGNPAALAENFRKNVRFISGVGVEYGENKLNVPAEGDGGFGTAGARPGCTLPPGKVSRYIDANPIDIQLDIPVLGQFRIYMFIPDVGELRQSVFLGGLCLAIAEPESLMSRLSAKASQSYVERPRVPSKGDIFTRPERYTAVSQLFAFALITSTPKENFEIADLPPILSRSPWTIYLDDVPDLDTQGSTCTDKYLGPIASNEVAVMNVRPDGYVGSLKKWSLDGPQDPLEVGKEAAAWLEWYYGGFLAVSGA